MHSLFSAIYRIVCFILGLYLLNNKVIKVSHSKIKCYIVFGVYLQFILYDTHKTHSYAFYMHNA